MVDFVEFLVNGQPPWDAYRALMSDRMIALDKQPGVRPVGVGETWRHLMAKWVLRVKVQESKSAHEMKQLAGGVEGVIEGGIHDMRLLWAKHSQEEDWVFLLVDAQNTLNEENWMSMLWDVQHEWTSGVQFTFNC